MKKFYWVFFGLLLVPGIASAEMISGVVTGIEGNKLTLTRSDNSENLTVKIEDQASLSSIAAGQQVSLDANKSFLGGWRGRLASAPSDASFASNDNNSSRAASDVSSHQAIESAAQDTNDSRSTSDVVGNNVSADSDSAADDRIPSPNSGPAKPGY